VALFKGSVALEAEVRQLSAVFSVAFLLGFSVVTAAQQSSPPATANTQDAQAVSVVKAALSALTGPSATVPTSLVASGTYTRLPNGSSQTYPIQLKVLGLTSFRWDTSEATGTVTTIVSGTSGSVQTPTVNRALAVGETFGRGAEIFPSLLISKWLGTAGLGLTWVGSETLNGQTVNHMTIVPPVAASPGTAPTLAQCELYTDPQTNLPVRVRVYQQAIDTRISTLLDLDFSGYQTVSGLLFPMSISFSIGGQTIGSLQFQSISVDASVSASDFVGSQP
jgi:hypothetical protein